MAAVFALAFLCMTAFSFSILFKKSIEEMLPVSMFSIILVLYLFYCFNTLFIGRMLVYAFAVLLTCYSVFYAYKNKINVLLKFTPGIFIFIFCVLFFYLYTRNNYSYLWDELRVWSAMPRAIYETEKLQLGNDAFIYKVMQSYPPSMPLFVYFIMALSPVFAEHYIFLAYAIFVAIILIPIFKNLKWNQFALFIPAYLFMIFNPCIFTSHGGDLAYFYESLHIDPILGYILGYLFYLSSNNPFSSKVNIFNFSLTLAVVIIIKDSGTLFAVIALINSLLIFFIENKPNLKDLLLKGISPITFILFSYFIWKILLRINGITNHLSLNIKLPSHSNFKVLEYGLENFPIVQFKNIVLSFSICFILFVLFFIIFDRKYYSKINSVISLSSIVVSVVFFSIGYLFVFMEFLVENEKLVNFSYQRYFTAIAIMLFVYLILKYIPEAISKIKLNLNNTIIIALLSILLLKESNLFFKDWDRKSSNNAFIPIAFDQANIINELIDSESDTKDIYFLMAEPEPNIIHHRVYFELISKNIRVKNYVDDTDMLNQYGDYTESIKITAMNWYNRLQKENYDYIYVYSVNDVYIEAFRSLGLEEPVAGKLYEIK